MTWGNLFPVYSVKNQPDHYARCDLVRFSGNCSRVSCPHLRPIPRRRKTALRIERPPSTTTRRGRPRRPEK